MIVLGDGDPWIWGIVAQYFPFDTQIVDLYHAREHLADLGKIVYGPVSDKAREWTEARKTQLDYGDVEAVVTTMRRLRPDKTRSARIRKAIDYFETNKERMRYAEFRRQGLFVGSGVMEAGCKTVAGANAIIALRCCQLSARCEEFWESRAAG